jgi:hypothetical protein
VTGSARLRRTVLVAAACLAAGSCGPSGPGREEEDAALALLGGLAVEDKVQGVQLTLGRPADR